MHDDRREPGGTGSRIMSGGAARRTRTNPPQMHGAMLSACADPAPSRSPSSAQDISVSIDACAPISASTATTAAAALAALPPSPLESGRPLRMVSATPRRSPSVVSKASTATPAVLRAASRGSRPPSFDDVVDADP